MRMLALALAAALTQPTAFGPLGDLANLAVDRVQLADLVAAAKFGTTLPIDDPVREQQVLTDVRNRSLAIGLDPEDGVRFFRDQIEANKIVQRGLFERWTRYPDEAPTRRPDLGTEVRPKLDRLTTLLLDELKETDQLRRPSLRCHVTAEVAERSASALRRLDRLHDKALSNAWRSVCV